MKKHKQIKIPSVNEPVVTDGKFFYNHEVNIIPQKNTTTRELMDRLS
jgi:hypothetical protein